MHGDGMNKLTAITMKGNPLHLPPQAIPLGAGTLHKWTRYKLGDFFDIGAHGVDSCDVGGYD